MSNAITYLKNLIDSAGGLQRLNRFNVIINAPDGTNTIPSTKISFGGRQIDTIADKLPGPGFGRNIPMTQNYSSYGSNSSNLVITFPIEQNWKTYKLIEDWMNTLVEDGSITNSVSFARPYDDWARPGFVRVECLNMNGSIKSVFLFSEAFPIKIQPIQLRSDVGNFAEFEVFFTFKNYKVV